MTAFTDYLTPETIGSIRAKMKGYAEAALLKISDWIPGDVGQQILEAVDQALWNASASASSLVRGYASLDTSTDPGDVDPYDPSNATRPAAPGYLSAKGLGDFGTRRIDETFATGTVTITNASGGAITFAPGRVTFTRDTNFAGQSYAPTYRNAADPAIYPDGTVTVSNGATQDIPVSAEEVGTESNAGAGHVSISTVLAVGVSATNASAILATNRESAALYRARCRRAAALTSPNGPADSYRYLATSARDDGTYGTSETGTPLGVTRVYVSTEAVDGEVTVYIAGDAGGAAVADALDIVTDLITTTPGVIAVPDAIGITVALATDTTIAITYTAKAKASSVTGASAGVYTQGAQGAAAPVFTAVEAAIAAYLASVDIGGLNQAAGAGVIPTKDLLGTIFGAWPTMNTVDVTTPAGATTAIALGHVAIAGVFTGTITLT